VPAIADDNRLYSSSAIPKLGKLVLRALGLGVVVLDLF
jgi:hypothetical protein